MRKVKDFDCVRMKESIQAKHAEEYVGMTPEQIREEVHRKLATSEHPVAVWWRNVSQAKTHSGV